jgi:hypothetical protein
MSKRSKAGLMAGGMLLTALVAWPVYAHCGRCPASANAMLKTMETGKQTLAKAIDMAEKHCKGKAVAAYCEMQEDGLEIKTICLVEDKIKAVKIDARAGKVTKVEDLKKLPDFHAKHKEEEGKKEAAGKPKAEATAAGDAQIVEAGCGSCIFKMADVQGCKLSVKIDGKPYLVSGSDVNAHKAGLCGASKQAEVRGRIEGDKFVASSFELKP